MKIRSVETFLMRHGLPRAIGPSTAYYRHRESLLVKIATNEGAVGWGETTNIGDVRAQIGGSLAAQLVGRDPTEHRALWRQLWGANFGNGLAVGTIDIALHDLWGKAVGCSVTELYGGRLRERVPIYASAMNYTEGVAAVDQYPAEAAAQVERGVRSMKMRLGGQPLHADVAAAAAVREAVGPQLRLMADGNGAYTLSTALQMGRQLDQLGFYWFEEPLPQPGYIGYDVLTAKSEIAIAGGELTDSRVFFRELLLRRVFDIAQPDVSLCGGIAECLFMAEMARLWAIPCMPHCWGGALVIAATLQLLSLLPDASWSRTTESPMLEYDVYENPFRDELLTHPFQLVEGSLHVPTTGPGLGIEVNEEVVRHYCVD